MMELDLQFLKRLVPWVLLHRFDCLIRPFGVGEQFVAQVKDKPAVILVQSL